MKKLINTLFFCFALSLVLPLTANAQFNVIIDDQCSSGINCYYSAQVDVYPGDGGTTGAIIGSGKCIGGQWINITPDCFYFGNYPVFGESVVITAYKYCELGDPCYGFTERIPYHEPLEVHVILNTVESDNGISATFIYYNPPLLPPAFTGISNPQSNNSPKLQISPNPSQGTTTFNLTFNGPEMASMIIYNAFGQKVKTLFVNTLCNPEATFTWDGTNDAGANVMAGIYICTLQSSKGSVSERLVLLE